VQSTKANVLADSEPPEGAWDLMRHGDARSRDSRWRQSIEALPVEQDGPGARSMRTGNALQDRALSGSVRADHRDRFAALHDEIEAFDSGDAAELLDKASNFEARTSKMRAGRRRSSTLARGLDQLVPRHRLRSV
jgi:hypothetical protein